MLATEDEAFMEPVVAAGGNRWQITEPQKRQKQAKTVAVGCDRLPIAAHGKEGVDGSSPSKGSKDVIPICLTAVSSGDDDAAAAVEVFRGRLQEERGHARA
jgi:hypothetical protein